jgi:hypothetical protein
VRVVLGVRRLLPRPETEECERLLPRPETEKREQPGDRSA